MKYHKPDLTHGLIHLTGDRIVKGGLSAQDALDSILKDGLIKGSESNGYIKGHMKATCFTEMPLSSLSYFIESPYTKHNDKPFGIAISKKTAWGIGARPVIYLPDNEALCIPENEKWRHVQFKLGEIDFTHEREWRAPNDFNMKKLGVYVIVPNSEHENRIKNIGSEFISNNILGYLHMDTLKDIL